MKLYIHAGKQEFHVSFICLVVEPFATWGPSRGNDVELVGDASPSVAICSLWSFNMALENLELQMYHSGTLAWIELLYWLVVWNMFFIFSI